MALNKLFADSAKHLDIYARKGVILNETLTANDSNGDAFDLSTYTAVMTVYQNDRTTSVITPTITMNNGSIDIDASAVLMDIDSDNYYFEIVVTLPSSAGDEVWLTGNFIVNDGIADAGTSATSIVINTGDASNQVTLSISTTDSITSLTDTNITSLADNQILTWDAGTSKWINEAPAAGVTDHGALTGLSDDDHTQYPLLVGRLGGQTIIGGTDASDDLTLTSTSNATKGNINIGDLNWATVGNIKNGGVNTIETDATNNVTIPSGTLTVSEDTDATTILGRARIYSAIGDNLYIGHIDSGTTEYAFRQTNLFRTIFNSGAGQPIDFRVGNSILWQIESTGNLLGTSGNDLTITDGGLIFNTSVLTDAATIDITASSHTLTSAVSRTFTISATGNDLTVELTLNATSATYTFPVGSLCVVEGVASGDNTAALTGVSGDKHIIAIKKVGSNYYVAVKNFGQ